MFNLIGNALKFTFEGGITVRFQFINGFLVSKVEDTGIGMKPTDLNLLFKFFG
jgi:signal transduction histidine kinase